ncbi:NAD(P)/FAD-dependent oxidoreductase [Actinokineospora spheciospongiae]|uniref:NAD(P)/FAD-dependent oxidoreductase n=1 Tax=Actinokineospora spheciospongiae TaxID=909613 RepID=UPI000D71BACA|nr:NAD(P)/FAD-dependent oxidoreductase [Actinokineospora spheciospongiae]PWW59516.1 thioredoxin reductase [Actinokineospora spheciospongiae]
MQIENNSYEAVVVGGGAAGLSAALVLGRARRSVLVIDAGEPRNAPAGHMHGYPSRDGMPPAEFLAVVRGEVSAYGVRIASDEVTGVAPDGGGGFDLTLATGGRVHARRLVVATGLVDELPGVPGVAERWGKDVLHCPYCHGWEVRDQPIGVLYPKAGGVHQALLFHQLSKDVTVFLDGVDVNAVPDAEWQLLRAAGICVVRGEIEKLEVAEDRLTGVRLTDGNFFPRSTFVVPPRMVPRDTLLSSLGAKQAETPFGRFVEVDATGMTSVPGVWAAGNITGPAEQVVNAASAGYRVGVAVNTQLVFADAERRAERQRTEVFTPENERAVARSRAGGMTEERWAG